jgi:hypothetical protein
VNARELLRVAAQCLDDAHTDIGTENAGKYADELRALAARLDAEEAAMRQYAGGIARNAVLECLARVDAPIDPAAPCGTCKGTGIDPRGPVYDTNPPMYTPCPDCRPPLGPER